MPTQNASPQEPPAARRAVSTRVVVLAFAAVEAVLIGWALISGRIH